jgi:fluoride ion exporter CrcB/FEX
MRTTVATVAARALGALARYAVDGAVARKATAFPWGTFAVNVSGSFLPGWSSPFLESA